MEGADEEHGLTLVTDPLCGGVCGPDKHVAIGPPGRPVSPRHGPTRSRMERQKLWYRCHRFCEPRGDSGTSVDERDFVGSRLRVTSLRVEANHVKLASEKLDRREAPFRAYRGAS